MLRARMALDSSYLGKIWFRSFFIEADYDRSSTIKGMAGYDRPKYLEADLNLEAVI
jgi:hypothetical protein